MRRAVAQRSGTVLNASDRRRLAVNWQSPADEKAPRFDLERPTRREQRRSPEQAGSPRSRSKGQPGYLDKGSLIDE